MSDQKTYGQEQYRDQANVPLLHGPITPEEQARLDETDRQNAKDKAEDAFKERQVKATEASNNLARKNVYLTAGTAIVAALACGATWYQGCMNGRSWKTAQDTLTQMKADSLGSSKQFQVQLGHFDAGLGQ